MAMNKNRVHLFIIILWLSFLLLFFGWCNLFSSNNYIHRHQNLSISHHTLSHRKILATKFDFTPFLGHHHRHHRRHRPRHVPDVQPEPSGNEIDPRYGVEKRLVPTGPNPLHH
ncbi:hypothetical protein COLO4_22708 [Corchorus olitorius]|uniref:CLAVATA3/ESR (CLE)-related protein 13 n=1 Tax=Corchorus olitorius TaxID=93759 RepID=A0A1R3IKG4_9ROSI|nr:hypothetical protein COLO4_22708 [Corchorus olitorius]